MRGRRFIRILILNLCNDKVVTIFDSTGLAVQDVATAWKVYEKAKKMNVGTWVKFFKETYGLDNLLIKMLLVSLR